MEFQERLDRAIQRGRSAKVERGREAAARQMTEAELRSLHSKVRLELVEHIDNCLRAIADRFPGFVFATTANDGGWGARISRDDVQFGGGAKTVYSRLEMLVRPFRTAAIVEMVVKGAIRNREVLNRSHFQRLNQVDTATFMEQVDLWMLEYAEQFASE